MENYVGIDLGTTNSAICTYNKDTLQTRVWKSPENNDVTPSAIYIDRRGSQFVGQTAYNAAPRSPDNCATLFKHFMGTTETIVLPAVNRTLTPEECSAEILKTLFGYLPEEIRNSPDIGTVITVPAAFNQMQKNATMKAAEMAGIGKVGLVQEPIAAVMSFMKTRNTDGIFLVYDLGDGTLDISVVESIRKRVSLLANGGIQVCGGRDFDRALVDNLVRPWLHDNFDLPNDLAKNLKFKKLLSLATWATERAKIELSAKEEATISLDEVDIGIEDLNGEKIYLDIPLQREFYNDLIADRINDTIQAARETLSKTGYTAQDVECIAWVGRPTHYKPLRDKVAFELGIKGDILAVNPMTAVAEGASIFAEFIFGHSEYPSKSENIKRDMMEHQDRLFDTYVGMDLLHNPFYILNATQRDNRQRIIDIAEERSLLSDSDKCMGARAELTNPRKRISAEVAWLPGVNPERIYDILLLLEASTGNQLGSNKVPSVASVFSLAVALSRLPYPQKSNVADEVLEILKLSKKDFREISEFLGINALTPIARANLLAARMLRLPDYTPDVAAEWVLTLTKTFENVNPSEVRAVLNIERQVSDFPEITELSDVALGIQNCRRYYQQVIKFVLENIPSAKARVKAVMMVIESATDSDTSRWPILVEDTVDVYEEGAATFFETVKRNIETQEKKIRIAADEGAADAIFGPMVDEFIETVKDWNAIAQPIQLNKNRQGLCHDASHDVAERVRQLAIFLFNEYDKLGFSQKILNVVKEVFREIPAIAERITADLETLNRIAERREQQIF